MNEGSPISREELNKEPSDRDFLMMLNGDKYTGMPKEDLSGRRTDVEIDSAAPNGVIVDNHVIVASEELTETEIDAIYATAEPERKMHVNPYVIEAWRQLELTLGRPEDSIDSEGRKIALSNVQQGMNNVLGYLGERTKKGDLNLLSGDDQSRYLAMGIAFEPAYSAQLEGRQPNEEERREIYQNMGGLLQVTLEEIATNHPERNSDSVRGALAELVTVAASAYPTGELLYPTPQRGFRHADVQLPYRDPQGRRVDRLIDLKLGTYGIPGTAPNRIRVGGMAIRAVSPKAYTGKGTSDRAFSSLLTIGQLMVDDSRGEEISEAGRLKIDRFAFGISQRIRHLNTQTGLDRYLQAA